MISTRFDDASRLNSVTTNNGETIVSFGYDDANRQTWEEQTVAGFPMRRVETPRDADGNRMGLRVPNPSIPPAPDWYSIQYDYTQRNQLWHIKDGEGSQWFTYSYDPAGNMTKRQDVYDGVNDSTNVMDANGVNQYDQLNRPLLWEQTATSLNGVRNTAFAWSHFSYDNLGRLKASWRNEQADKGEWFGYNATGQLTDVFYNADGVSTGPPQNASRTVAYTIAPNALNRLSMNDNGDVSDYTPNALNQYLSVAGGDLYYDANFNFMWSGGFSAWYDSANRLRSVTSGENYGEFTYDGLGRCLKRTVDWETTLIAYDGWKPTVEWDEWNGLRAWNIYGPGPDEILYRYDAYLDIDLRYHLDRMGNVVFVLDSDGNGIERYTYDAFGHPTVTDWNGENPRPYSWYGNRFMFTGREYFAGLGLYDYRNRFYHPILGRFLQTDPIGFAAGDMNLFRYCGGDPVNGSDPFGLVEDNIVDYDPYDGKPVYGDPVNERREPWSVFGPINDYLNSLFADDKSRMNENPDPAQSLPYSGGLLMTAEANLGLIYGAGANVSLAYGVYSNDKPGGWESAGAMLGGPTGAYGHIDPKSVNQIPLILGGGVSIAGGAWFSNAATRQDLMGPFATFGIDLPWFSSTYSTDHNGIYVITVTYGFPPGAAVSSYPTDTKPLGGH